MQRQTGREGQELGVQSEKASLDGVSQGMVVSGPLHVEETTSGLQEIKMRGTAKCSKRENLFLLCQLLPVVSPTPTLISSILNCRLLETIPDPLGSWTLDSICQCKHSWGIGKR